MKDTAKCCSVSLFLGRLFISLIFILAGIGKLLNYDQTAQYMASKGMTMIPLFLIAAAVIELLGGLSLLLGFKTRVGATLLLLFLIPVTIIFHDFWNLQGAEQHAMLIEFMKNLAIFGGLFYVLSVGPGRWSLDALCCCSSSCGTDSCGTKS